MAQNPTDASVSVPNTGTAPIRVETVTDANGNVVDEQVVLVEGIVNDTRSGNLNPGDTTPVSITTDGRLRVASSSADTALDFFGDQGQKMFTTDAMAGMFDTSGFDFP